MPLEPNWKLNPGSPSNWFIPRGQLPASVPPVGALPLATWHSRGRVVSLSLSLSLPELSCLATFHQGSHVGPTQINFSLSNFLAKNTCGVASSSSSGSFCRSWQISKASKGLFNGQKKLRAARWFNWALNYFYFSIVARALALYSET